MLVWMKETVFISIINHVWQQSIVADKLTLCWHYVDINIPQYTRSNIKDVCAQNNY